MKRFIAIFFLVVYSSIALGISLNYHYCGNQLTKISVLNFGGKTDCGCNDHGIPMPCCKDKLHAAKSDNHKTVQQATLKKIISLVPKPIPISEYVGNLHFGNNTFISLCSLADKRSCSRPIFLLSSVFRI